MVYCLMLFHRETTGQYDEREQEENELAGRAAPSPAFLIQRQNNRRI